MSNRALITSPFTDRLVRLCGMFGSDHVGERANAAALADQLVRQLGLTWKDVIVSPPPEWQAMLHHCRQHPHMLNLRERDFVFSLAQRRYPPTDRQLDWLTAIYNRLTREMAA